MAMIRYSRENLVSEPACLEIYKIVRNGFVDNGSGININEIKDQITGYSSIKILHHLSQLNIVGIILEEAKERDGKSMQTYRPNPMSEWAVDFERKLGLDPTKVGFDWEALGK